jgi:hypothetical protein
MWSAWSVPSVSASSDLGPTRTSRPSWSKRLTGSGTRPNGMGDQVPRWTSPPSPRHKMARSLSACHPGKVISADVTDQGPARRTPRSSGKRPVPGCAGTGCDLRVPTKTTSGYEPEPWAWPSYVELVFRRIREIELGRDWLGYVGLRAPIRAPHANSGVGSVSTRRPRSQPERRIRSIPCHLPVDDETLQRTEERRRAS